MKKAFTLAEIMIVLTVIGVLSAILLPSAFQAIPNEKIMKFKKANSTLMTVIKELANSDKYYMDGDLGTSARSSDGSIATTYFCQTFADVITTKELHCAVQGGDATNTKADIMNGTTKNDIPNMKKNLDTYCKNAQKNGIKASSASDAETLRYEFKTPDDIEWFQASPATTFAATASSKRVFSDPNGTINNPDEYGFDRYYKVFCFDVDGGDGGTNDKSAPPFGYGIRADGKVISGALADEWIALDIQDESK